MTYSHQEAGRIRSLAKQVAAIAREPRMAAIKRRWADVNALRKPDRAPVWCRPVGCWKEIITPDMLVCRDEWLRQLEYRFLQILHKRDIDDDHPIEGHVKVAAVWERTPANTWGVDVDHRSPGQEGDAWGYDPPLKRGEDLDKLAMPRFTYCAEETARRKERLEALIGDILPVKVVAGPPLSATLGTAAADLRGLGQMMMDMIDAPDLMHRLMAYLRDANLSALDQLEATGLITPNNAGPMTCSDRIGEPGEEGKLSCKNLWCMANSQEFDPVSPKMWEEFCLDYQKPILERFGLVGYGCCEDLTLKIDGALSIPNLRIIVCSAWTSLEAVQEAVGQDYVIMWRQKASEVVFPDAVETIRRDLELGCKQLQGFHYQIVLRELETLSGHPDRLHEWTRHAKDAAERYSV
jgi:hypothetical protein